MLILKQPIKNPPTVQTDIEQIHAAGVSQRVVAKGGLVVKAQQTVEKQTNQTFADIRANSSNTPKAVETKQLVQEKAPDVKKEGAQLFVNGKERKITKSSRYLLDMMTFEDE